MKLILLRINRFIQFIRCLKKNRYGYLDRDLCFIPAGSERLVLILSPDLYRICVASLPVATAKEAVAYASSYFDESENENFFSAYKMQDNTYLFCAFFPQIVRSRLEAFHVDLSLVEHFIFAQEVFSEMNLPVTLKNESVLVSNEGVITRLRSEYVSETPKLTIEEFLKNISTCLIGFKANLAQHGEISKKTAILTIALLSAVLMNLLFQGIYFHNETEKIVNEQAQMIEEKQLPSTQMELESLVSSWEKKEKNQIKMRKNIAAFSTLSLENNHTTVIKQPSMPLSQENTLVLIPGSKPSEKNVLLVSGDSNNSSKATASEYVSSLIYENGGVTFEISTPSQERAEKIRDAVSKILRTNTIAVKRNLVEGSVK